MTTWRVFATGSPANPNLDDGNPYTLHTGFRITSPGNYWVIGVEWFAPTVLPTGDVTVGLFARVDDSTSGGILAQKTVAASSLVAATRNAIMFDPGDEVLVTQAATTGFYASVYTSGRYTSTGSYFGTDDVSGPITAWTNGTIGGNGRFFAGGAGLTYPNGQFAAGGYWMSPIVTDVDPAGTTDLNLTDRSGPALAGGAADRLAIDQIRADRSGPLQLAGSPAALVQELVLPDRSGPALAGGAADALASVVILTDRPGGLQLGGSLEVFTQDRVFTEQSGPAFAGGSADVLVQGAAEPLDLTDRPGSGVLAGGAADVLVVAEASGDTSVWPALVQALACLENAVDTLPSPPKYRSIRTGVSIIAAISENEDECCAGLAWVRVVSISPTNAFPQPDGQYSGCPPVELAVELELGIIRCAPVMAGGGNEFLVPTTAQHLAAAQAVMNDAAALRTAACCLGEQRAVVVGTWTPVPTETNCMGGTMRVTVSAPFCERTC